MLNLLIHLLLQLYYFTNYKIIYCQVENEYLRHKFKYEIHFIEVLHKKNGAAKLLEAFCSWFPAVHVKYKPAV